MHRIEKHTRTSGAVLVVMLSLGVCGCGVSEMIEEEERRKNIEEELHRIMPRNLGLSAQLDRGPNDIDWKETVELSKLEILPFAGDKGNEPFADMTSGGITFKEVFESSLIPTAGRVLVTSGGIKELRQDVADGYNTNGSDELLWFSGNDESHSMWYAGYGEPVAAVHLKYDGQENYNDEKKQNGQIYTYDHWVVVNSDRRVIGIVAAAYIQPRQDEAESSSSGPNGDSSSDSNAKTFGPPGGN